MMLLDGMKAIRQLLGNCGKAKVRAYVAAGAPIRVIGMGVGKRYVADSEALMDWIRKPPALSGN